MSNQLNKFGGGNEDQCDGQKDGKSPSRDRLKQLIGESKEVPFLVQLQTMLDQETYNNSDAIQWLETGDGFVITDQNKLVKEIIPKFFPKPIIFQSFVRKLYKFSFRQIDSSNKGRYEFVSNNNDFHRKTTKPFIHVDAKIDDATRSKTSNFLDNEENNYDASSYSNLVGLSEAQHTENGITDIFSNTSNLITRSLRSYGIPQNEWQPQLQSFLHLNSIKNTQLWRKLNDSIGTDGEPSQIEAEKIVLKILMHLQSQQPQQRRQIQEEEGMATLTESNATASVESSNVVESMQTNKSRNSGHVHQNNPTSSCMLRREIEQQFIRFESTMSHLLNRYNPNEQHITDLFLALRSANNIQDGDVHRNLQQQQQETAVSEENNIFENSFLRHQKGLMLLLHHHHQQQLDSKIGRLSKTASGKIGLPSFVSAPATDAVFGIGNSAVPFDLNESQQLQLLGTERNTGNSHIERVVNDHDNNNNSKVLQSNIPVHLLSNIYQNVLSSENQAEHHQNTRTRMLAQPPGGGGVEMLLSHQMQHLNDHAKNDQQHGRVWATGPSSLEEMLKLLHRLQGQSQTGSAISQSQDRPSHMTFFEIGQLLQIVSNQQGQRNYSSLPAESAFATATSLGPSEPITTFFADAARSPRKVSSEIILNNAKSFDSQRENDHRGCESGWEYILSELIRQKMAQNRELGAQDPSYNQQRSGSGSGSGLLNPGLSQQQQNQKNDWHENSRDNASSSVPMPGFSIIDYLTRDYVCSSSACQTDDAAESQDQDRKPSSEQERARDPRKILRQSELVRGLSGIGVDTNSNLGLLTMQRKGIELQDREEHVSASAAVEATTAVAAAASSTSLTRQQEEAARIDAYHSYLRMKLNENSDADSHWKDDRGVENGESGDEADEKSEWGSGKKSKKRKI